MKPLLVCRHSPEDTPGILGHVLGQRGQPWLEYRAFDPGAINFDPLQHAGLIVLGGPMCANDTERHPFLAMEMTWLATAVQLQLPVLGICLGAQLLARVLGARVYKNPKPEIGWIPVSLTPEGLEDPICRPLAPEATMFHWHEDTFELPPGAVRLAYSVDCRNQAFRYGINVYGVQFHPEATREIVECWSLDLPSPKQQTMLRDSHVEMASMQERSRKLFDQWLDLVTQAGA